MDEYIPQPSEDESQRRQWNNKKETNCGNVPTSNQTNWLIYFINKYSNRAIKILNNYHLLTNHTSCDLWRRFLPEHHLTWTGTYTTMYEYSAQRKKQTNNHQFTNINYNAVTFISNWLICDLINRISRKFVGLNFQL